MNIKKNKNFAVILAAGKGTRMKSDIPKQFLLLGEHPVIWYSLKAFNDSQIDEIILVADEADISYCMENYFDTGEFGKLKFITAGGKERYESVYNGLKKISGTYGRDVNGNVLIHDGARPFVTSKMVDDMLDRLKSEKACIFGMPVKDTIKEADSHGQVVNTPDRKKMWQIQTPQGFLFSKLMSAYERVLEDNTGSRECITDDAMIWERVNKEPVFIMKGSYRNIKITTPEDLAAGEAFLKF